MRIKGVLMLSTRGRAVLQAGEVLVRAGRIADVRVSAGNRVRVTTADGIGETIVLPGFIDAHVHLPQFDSIGQDGRTLLNWLRTAVFPTEARWADTPYARAMAQRVARELISFGTTGVVAYATSHHAAARAALEELGRAGLRGLVGQVLMDRGPVGLRRGATDLLREAESLCGARAGRMGTALTPRFALSCSAGLLRGVGEIAARTGSLVQTHLAEMEAECREVKRRFGRRYLQVYDVAGLARRGAIFAHAVWLSPADRRLLARRGAVVAHCPTANLFLRSGAMDLSAMRKAGVRVALGSDVAGGPDRSMVRVARAMIETAKRLGHAAPSPAQAWYAITAGNAEALGWKSGGRLRAGGDADLIVIRPTVAWRRAADPLGALLYAWDDRWITRVIAAGRTVYSAAPPERSIR